MCVILFVDGGWVKVCNKRTNVPANTCLFKVNNRNSRKRCEIYSNLTIKTPEQRQ